MNKYPKAFERYWKRCEHIFSNVKITNTTAKHVTYNAWRAGVREGSGENYHNRYTYSRKAARKRLVL